MTTDYHSAQEDFNCLISKLPPWVLSNFIMWLDIRVAEYKIFGRILSGEPLITIAFYVIIVLRWLGVTKVTQGVRCYSV